MTTTQLRSPLELPHPDHEHKAFFAETLTLLRSVRDHDFDTLAALCDDDFGIIDVDPSGTPVPVRTRAEWEAWFHDLFATLTTMGASTDSEILAYDSLREGALGYSVVEFRQRLDVGSLSATFDCIATIIWKRTPDGWREARWHASVIASEVPDELRAAASA